MRALHPPSIPSRPARAALARHGGDLAAARATFPGAPEPWIDLSTGINPHAYPVGEIAPALWRRLPETDAVAGLQRAARGCYGVPDAAGLVAAPGTQALIQLLPRVLPARRVAVLGFGYQEHPATWRAAGAEVVLAHDPDELAGADVAVVTNPNNPDGRFTPPGDLLDIAGRLARTGGTLVVDEAFVDVLAPGTSLVPRLPPRGVLVLRSFGKFFGLAGLRLGFATGDAALCAALQDGLGPWAVAGPALTIGRRALADIDWQAGARCAAAAAADRLDALLGRAGLEVLGGTPLFRLAAHPDAAAVFHRLGTAGILTRPFASEPTWLRFGLPHGETAWARLADALTP